jgi:transcription elongation factor GreB
MEKKQALAAGKATIGPEVEADQREIETAIRRLQQTLGSVIVAELPADQDRAAFGATVTIRRGTGEEESYRIVGVEEGDPGSGAISWISPLARALLSRRAGDKVLFRSPAGDEELTILTVHFPNG